MIEVEAIPVSVCDFVRDTIGPIRIEGNKSSVAGLFMMVERYRLGFGQTEFAGQAGRATRSSKINTKTMPSTSRATPTLRATQNLRATPTSRTIPASSPKMPSRSWLELKELFQKAGWPHLARGRATQALQGYPSLAKGRATSAAKGWPTLKAWRDTHREEILANLARAHAKQGAEGYQNLVRSRAWQAANDHPQLQIGHVAKRDETLARWKIIIATKSNWKTDWEFRLKVAQCWAHEICNGINPKRFIVALEFIGFNPGLNKALAADWQKRAMTLATTWTNRGYDHHGKEKGKLSTRKWNQNHLDPSDLISPN